MTIGCTLKQEHVLMLAVGAAVLNLDDVLRLVGRHHYDRVSVYGDESDRVSDTVWSVVKKAEYHGVPIENSTPVGSEFSRGLAAVLAA